MHRRAWNNAASGAHIDGVQAHKPHDLFIHSLPRSPAALWNMCIINLAIAAIKCNADKYM
jgi:hypothetical protein